MLVVLILGIFSASGEAQTKREKIQELLHLTSQDSLMEKTFNGMLSSMLANIESKVQDSTQRARFNKMTQRLTTVMGEIKERIIKEDMVEIYDKYFTVNEIQDFIDFYKTPSGQKMLMKMPDIQKDIMQSVFQKYMPLTQEKLREQAGDGDGH